MINLSVGQVHLYHVATHRHAEQSELLYILRRDLRYLFDFVVPDRFGGRAVFERQS